ncbi:hypothetical protein CDAR_90221 [Caerostris darwini]|uniref:Uncharacterized protein n=1 Tax=Caerostris darwini TaxID=1538125 RepID=A0AAV4NTU5_9ARAC|nr:hypothetical protein CDAR_90221 [Caerostris darwini]
MPPSIQKMHLLVPLAAKSIHYKIRYGSNPSVFFQPPIPLSSCLFSKKSQRSGFHYYSTHSPFPVGNPHKPFVFHEKGTKDHRIHLEQVPMMAEVKKKSSFVWVLSL